jgi:predicted PurR-regulated permease PerM
MLRKNVGGFDRMLRFVAGVVLIPVGLLALGGRDGNVIGIIVAAFALIPLVTSLIGFCPAYVPFRFSTRAG